MSQQPLDQFPIDFIKFKEKIALSTDFTPEERSLILDALSAPSTTASSTPIRRTSGRALIHG